MTMKSNLTELIKTGIGGSIPKATAEKLAPQISEYLIRSGMVIVLPHKLESDVWCLVTPCGDCDDRVPYEECLSCNKWKIEKLPFDLEMVDEWGKYVFPTKEEAEEALMEKQKNEN